MAALLPLAVRGRVSAVHGAAALPELLRLHDEWAVRYGGGAGNGVGNGAAPTPAPPPLSSVSPQDVAALQYRPPVLAAAAVAAAVKGPRGAARVHDVCCGTGLVAGELQWHGFSCLDGVDSSAEMLCQAWASGLYQELWHCIVGSEPLPMPAGHYDAVTVVGALGKGQVPSAAVTELLHITQPGGLLCMTTQSNPSNLQYKAKLEATLEQLENQEAWEKVLAQEEECWKRATSEEESTQGTGYISGVVCLYWKCPIPPLPKS